jgi:hypothetical protein
MRVAWCVVCLASVVRAENPGPSLLGAAESSQTQNWVSLPTDRDIRNELPGEPLVLETPPDFARLLRPRFRLAAEWELPTNGIEIGNVDGRVTMPTYPLFGPPPPMITAAVSYTNLTAPDALNLPTSLYDFSLGAAWVRPINERWILRFMATAAFATDLDNTSSDAWQFRGGVFSTYKWRPDLQIVLGAFASGRDDLPVLPGVGAIWTPSPLWRVDLMMPRPRISYMLVHTGQREHWVYLGGGLSGGTWAFERQQIDDKLTYRQWRLVLGWESIPPKQSTFIPGDGWKLHAEIGYAFAREFEFERRTGDVGFDSTLLLRAGVGY